MRQAFGRLPHCTWFQLVVELQRELNISRRLGCVDHARVVLRHRGVRRCKVHAVERIQEVTTELNLEAFRYVEVLMHADVPVVEARTAQATELRCARSEGCCWVAVVGRIKPLESAALCCGGVLAAEYGVGAVAIRTQTARTGAGWIGSAGVQRLWEAGVERQDWANLP